MQFAVNEFQEQLIRGLAHRMNNILSLFQGYLGLLLEDQKLDSVTREGLAKIKEGTRAATELMERAQALARHTGAVWRDVAPCELLRQLRPTFEGFCSPRVKLEIECPDNLPTVWADASRMRMAVSELVKNACEAAKSSVRVRVGSLTGSMQGEQFEASADSSEQWLKIEVTDDGPGIPPELAERVYHPFYSTKKITHAAGLGLTVALACAQQLRGTLSHRSKPGETIFTLMLPSRLDSEVNGSTQV